MTDYPGWLTLAAVPAVRGAYPLTTQAEREAAFDRFATLAQAAITTNARPHRPVLVGRRQVRFEGIPAGQLHQDGSFYAARPINIRPSHHDPEGPRILYHRGLELDLVTLVQASAAWAAESGAAGDLMISAALHRFDDSDAPVHLRVSEHSFSDGPPAPLPPTPAQTTANLAAIINDKREAVVTACALASDLLADMGAHQPSVLTSDGDIVLARLGDHRHHLTGWSD